MSSCFRFSCVPFSALLAVATLACIDPKKTFDEFGERVVDASPEPDAREGEDAGGLSDVSGEFLLSIQLTLGRPIRFIATSTFEATDDGALLDLVFQPIADEMCAAGMGGQPVGDPLELDDVPVSADGTFDVAQTGTTVPAAANGVSCSNVQADIQLIGGTRSADLICGDVVVMALGMQLQGTFGATRIEPGTVGDENLPTPVTACP